MCCELDMIMDGLLFRSKRNGLRMFLRPSSYAPFG
jgi:hypothetical protein